MFSAASLVKTRHSVLYGASQRIVCFAGLNNAKYQKMDISMWMNSKRDRRKRERKSEVWF